MSDFTDLVRKNIAIVGGLPNLVRLIRMAVPQTSITEKVITSWLKDQRRPTYVKICHLALGLSYSNPDGCDRILNECLFLANYNSLNQDDFTKSFQESRDNKDPLLTIGWVESSHTKSGFFGPYGNSINRLKSTLNVSSYTSVEFKKFKNLPELYEALKKGFYKGKPLISDLIPVAEVLNLHFLDVQTIDGSPHGYGLVCSQLHFEKSFGGALLINLTSFND